MARNLVTSANVVISMNGRQASQTMHRLQDEARNLTQQIDKARKAGDTVTATRLNRQLQEVNRTLRMMESNTTAVENVLRDLDRASPAKLQATLRTLRRQLDGIERGSEAWDAHVEKIRRVQAELDRVNSSLREQESRWQRLNRWLNDTQTFLAGAAAAVAGLTLAGKKAVESFAEMDQEMANVRKYTGMTAEEVEALNEQFRMIDTRTTREDLNRLAQEAGRLGKTAGKDVLGFVRAADKINVALDDLGDGATLTLSKLTGIFGEEERLGTERSLLAVGSVINELSQNCSASAPYIAQFASRMGGVAAQAGMTVQQVMALAAVLDTTNQGVEAASTAVSQVITRMFQDPAKYARAAGIEVEKFTRVLREDTNEALLLLLDTLQKSGGMEALAPMFKDMGETGARAVAALSSLATHISEVREQQDAANTAFREATSIDKEFQVQNTTKLAAMEKSRKSLDEIAVSLGQKLQPVMGYVLSSSTVFLKVLSTLVSFVGSNARAIISLTAAVVAYHVAVRAAAVSSRAHSAALVTGKVAVQAYQAALLLMKAAFMLCTGQIGKATVAFRAFSAAIKANPIGLLVSVVTAAASALAAMAMKTDEYKESMDKAMASATSFTGETSKEIREIDRLFGALEGARKGTKEYEDAKKAIVSGYSGYLKGLINERGEITNLALAYDRLAFAAGKSARIRGVNAARESLDSSFFGEIDSLTEELRSSLEEMGMGERDSSRLITAISQSVAQGRGVPASVYAEILGFQEGNAGFWKRNFGTMPSEIADKINARRTDYDRRSEKLEGMDTRYFKDVSDKELDEAINSISGSLSSTVVNGIDVGLYDVSGKIREGMRSVVAEAFNPESATIMKHITPSGSLLKPDTVPGIIGAAKDRPEGQSDPVATVPVPMIDAGKVGGTLSRSQAEALVRELMFEKAMRGHGQDVKTVDPEFGEIPDTDPEVKPTVSPQEAARARKEAVLASEEFRQGMEEIRAAHERTDKEIVRAYSEGSLGYLDYLDKRKEAELDYCDKAAEFFRSHLEDIKDLDISADKDYREILGRRQKAESEYDSRSLAYRRDMIRREASDKEKELQREKEDSLDAEIRFLDSRTELRLEALGQERDLYEEGSREWEAVSLRIESEKAGREYELQKVYAAKVAELKKKYASQSAADRYDLELQVLQRLYKAEKISHERFLEWKLQLDREYDRKREEDRSKIPGMDYRRTPDELRREAEKERKSKLDDIDSALASGTISEDEAERARRKVDSDSRDGALSRLRQSDQWVSMFTDVAVSWEKLLSEMDLGWENLFQNIQEVAASTFAVVNAAMQYNAQMAQANAQIELAALEKRYDREIELAQGNAYLTAKLEKEKSKKEAEIKNKASRASYNMQVIQAIAQAVQGSMAAFNSALATPVIGPAIAPVAAAVALAAGMANVALIKKQQQAAEASGYAEGGFTRPGGKYEVAGVVHAGEWVASRELVNSPRTRPIIDMLEQAQRANTIGSLTTSDVSNIVATGAATVAASAGGKPAAVAQTREKTVPQTIVREISRESGSKMEDRLSEVLDRLSGRLDEPFYTINTVTGPYGSKQAEDEYAKLMANKNRKHKLKK